MRVNRLLFLPFCLALAVGAVYAGSVSLEADRDATLIENPAGAKANGSGPSFFVGRTTQDANFRRRGLVRFDVASAVPADAIIESATLILTMNPGHPTESTVRVYRVQADWGEGPSFSAGGSGADSLPGDATWLHTFYDDAEWVRAGGQFLGRFSAETPVTSAGTYVWEGGHLLEDVRLWHKNPGRNFGWILIGDEAVYQSSKSFASREDAEPSVRPTLEITYR